MKKIGPQVFYSEALPGLMPLAEWLICAAQLFLSTDFAFKHPALALIVLLPGYCAINSKLIVCSVTNMEVEKHAIGFYSFMLIPFNKYMELGMDENWLIIFSFGLSLFQYWTWVTCTIGQICEFLDIGCLTIKSGHIFPVAEDKTEAAEAEAEGEEGETEEKKKNRKELRAEAKKNTKKEKADGSKTSKVSAKDKAKASANKKAD